MNGSPPKYYSCNLIILSVELGGDAILPVLFIWYLYHSPPWSYQPIPMTITLRLQSYPFVVLHSSRIPFGLFPAGTPPYTLHSLVRRRAYAIVCNDLYVTIVH